MNGAAAMSVEMCEVTEISNADGMAASETQRAASAQVGAGSGSASAAGTCEDRAERSISTPHHTMSTISTTNSTAQPRVCCPSVVSGSITNGYESNARKLPMLLAA